LVPADLTENSDLSIERGRQVYLSEGCIHCHSQYVRPGSIDEEIWGPVREVAEVLGGKPVLIGNRRQGPDLSNVGARRSEAWLKIQLTKPQAIVPGSAMPRYADLFETDRGNDLIRYLKQSGVQGTGSVIQRAARWMPDGRPVDGEGRVLFGRHCAACHGQEGFGNGPISLELARKPANLVAGPFAWTPPGEALDLRVARVIKFGLPGTDMPGHEVLTDSEVLALAREVVNLRAH
jgi:mono/diheme cytochrome c family protein